MPFISDNSKVILVCLVGHKPYFLILVHDNKNYYTTNQPESVNKEKKEHNPIHVTLFLLVCIPLTSSFRDV